MLLPHGSYSDYYVSATVRCLKDLDIHELAQRYVEQAPSRQSYAGNRVVDSDPSPFALWLMKRGWVEEIPYVEVHTGDSYFDLQRG